MKNDESNKIISLISYKQSMLCKAMACLLILCFSITNLTYGYDRSDIDHLRQARESNVAKVHAEFGADSTASVTPKALHELSTAEKVAARKPSPNLTPFIYAILSTAAFGFGPIAVKYLHAIADLSTFTASIKTTTIFFMSVYGIILLLSFLKKAHHFTIPKLLKGLPLKSWIYLLSAAIANAISGWCFFAMLGRLDPLSGAIMMTLQIASNFVLAYFVLKEPIRKRKWASFGLITTGTLLTALYSYFSILAEGETSGITLAILFIAFLSSQFAAWRTVSIKRVINDYKDIQRTEGLDTEDSELGLVVARSSYMFAFLFTFVISSLVCLCHPGSSFSLHNIVLLHPFVIVLGLIYGLAYSFRYIAMTNIEASRIALITSLMSVFTAFYMFVGFVILGVGTCPSWVQIPAAILVVSGSYLVSKTDKKRPITLVEEKTTKDATRPVNGSPTTPNARTSTAANDDNAAPSPAKGKKVGYDGMDELEIESIEWNEFIVLPAGLKDKIVDVVRWAVKPDFAKNRSGYIRPDEPLVLDIPVIGGNKKLRLELVKLKNMGHFADPNKPRRPGESPEGYVQHDIYPEVHPIVDKDLNIHPEFVPPIPMGGERYRYARMEYGITGEAFYKEADTAIPIAIIKYKGLSFEGEPLGVVVMGCFEEEDRRFGDIFVESTLNVLPTGLGVLNLGEYGCQVIPDTTNFNSIFGYLINGIEAWASSLKEAGKIGLLLPSPHPFNISFVKDIMYIYDLVESRWARDFSPEQAFLYHLYWNITYGVCGLEYLMLQTALGAAMVQSDINPYRHFLDTYFKEALSDVGHEVNEIADELFAKALMVIRRGGMTDQQYNMERDMTANMAAIGLFPALSMMQEIFGIKSPYSSKEFNDRHVAYKYELLDSLNRWRADRGMPLVQPLVYGQDPDDATTSPVKKPPARTSTISQIEAETTDRFLPEWLETLEDGVIYHETWLGVIHEIITTGQAGLKTKSWFAPDAESATGFGVGIKPKHKQTGMIGLKFDICKLWDAGVRFKRLDLFLATRADRDLEYVISRGISPLTALTDDSKETVIRRLLDLADRDPEYAITEEQIRPVLYAEPLPGRTSTAVEGVSQLASEPVGRFDTSTGSQTNRLTGKQGVVDTPPTARTSTADEWVEKHIYQAKLFLDRIESLKPRYPVRVLFACPHGMGMSEMMKATSYAALESRLPPDDNPRKWFQTHHCPEPVINYQAINYDYIVLWPGIPFDRRAKIVNEVKKINPRVKVLLFPGTDYYHFDHYYRLILMILKDNYDKTASADWAYENVILQKWPYDDTERLRNLNLVQQAGGLESLLCVISKHELGEIKDKGVRVLAEDVTDSDIEHYIKKWTFSDKDKAEITRVFDGQWLLIEAKDPHSAKSGRCGRDGPMFPSVSLGPERCVSVIPPQEPWKIHWLTFHWPEAEGDGWEKRDYYFWRVSEDEEALAKQGYLVRGVTAVDTKKAFNNFLNNGILPSYLVDGAFVHNVPLDSDRKKTTISLSLVTGRLGETEAYTIFGALSGKGNILWYDGWLYVLTPEFANDYREYLTGKGVLVGRYLESGKRLAGRKDGTAEELMIETAIEGRRDVGIDEVTLRSADKEPPAIPSRYVQSIMPNYLAETQSLVEMARLAESKGMDINWVPRIPAQRPSIAEKAPSKKWMVPSYIMVKRGYSEAEAVPEEAELCELGELHGLDKVAVSNIVNGWKKDWPYGCKVDQTTDDNFTSHVEWLRKAVKDAIDGRGNRVYMLIFRDEENDIVSIESACEVISFGGTNRSTVLLNGPHNILAKRLPYEERKKWKRTFGAALYTLLFATEREAASSKGITHDLPGGSRVLEQIGLEDQKSYSSAQCLQRLGDYLKANLLTPAATPDTRTSTADEASMPVVTDLLRIISANSEFPDNENPNEDDKRIYALNEAVYGLLYRRGVFDKQTAVHPGGGLDGATANFGVPTVIIEMGVKERELEIREPELSKRLSAEELREKRPVYLEGNAKHAETIEKLKPELKTSGVTIILKGVSRYLFDDASYYGNLEQKLKDCRDFIDLLIKEIHPGQFIILDSKDASFIQSYIEAKGYKRFDGWLSDQEESILSEAMERVAKAGEGSNWGVKFGTLHFSAPSAAVVLRAPPSLSPTDSVTTLPAQKSSVRTSTADGEVSKLKDMALSYPIKNQKMLDVAGEILSSFTEEEAAVINRVLDVTDNSLKGRLLQDPYEGMLHALTVTSLAIDIAKREEVSSDIRYMEKLIAACVFHDIGKYIGEGDHPRRGAEAILEGDVVKLAELGFTGGDISAISGSVARHGGVRGSNKAPPDLVEFYPAGTGASPADMDSLPAIFGPLNDADCLSGASPHGMHKRCARIERCINEWKIEDYLFFNPDLTTGARVDNAIERKGHAKDVEGLVTLLRGIITYAMNPDKYYTTGAKAIVGEPAFAETAIDISLEMIADTEYLDSGNRFGAAEAFKAALAEAKERITSRTSSQDARTSTGAMTLTGEQIVDLTFSSEEWYVPRGKIAIRHTQIRQWLSHICNEIDQEMESNLGIAIQGCIGTLIGHTIPNAIDAVFEAIDKNEISKESGMIRCRIFIDKESAVISAKLSDTGVGIKDKVCNGWEKPKPVFLTTKKDPGTGVPPGYLGKSWIGITSMLDSIRKDAEKGLNPTLIFDTKVKGRKPREFIFSSEGEILRKSTGSEKVQTGTTVFMSQRLDAENAREISARLKKGQAAGSKDTAGRGRTSTAEGKGRKRHRIKGAKRRAYDEPEELPRGVMSVDDFLDELERSISEASDEPVSVVPPDEERGWFAVPLDTADPYYIGYKWLVPEALHDALDNEIESTLGGSGDILEIGSGTGFFYDFAKSDIRSRLKMLEPNREFLAEAVRKNRGVMGESLFYGTAQKIPFINGSFGAVVGYASFDAISNLSKAIEESHRVLWPGRPIVSYLGVRPDPIVNVNYMRKRGFYRWKGRIVLTPKLELLDPRPDFWYVNDETDIARLERYQKMLEDGELTYGRYCKKQDDLLRATFHTDIYKKRMTDSLKGRGFTDIEIYPVIGRAEVPRRVWERRIDDFIHSLDVGERPGWLDREGELYELRDSDKVNITIQNGADKKRYRPSNKVETSIEVMVIKARKGTAASTAQPGRTSTAEGKGAGQSSHQGQAGDHEMARPSISRAAIRRKDEGFPGDLKRYLEHVNDGVLPSDLAKFKRTFKWPVDMSDPGCHIMTYYDVLEKREICYRREMRYATEEADEPLSDWEQIKDSEVNLKHEIDIMAPAGTPVNIVEGGKVVYAEYNEGAAEIWIYSEDTHLVYGYVHLDRKSADHIISEYERLRKEGRFLKVEAESQVGTIKEFRESWGKEEFARDPVFRRYWMPDAVREAYGDGNISHLHFEIRYYNPPDPSEDWTQHLEDSPIGGYEGYRSRIEADGQYPPCYLTIWDLHQRDSVARPSTRYPGQKTLHGLAVNPLLLLEPLYDIPSSHTSPGRTSTVEWERLSVLPNASEIQNFFDKGYYIDFEPTKHLKDRLNVTIRHRAGAERFRDGHMMGDFFVDGYFEAGDSWLGAVNPHMPPTGEGLGRASIASALLMLFGGSTAGRIFQIPLGTDELGESLSKLEHFDILVRRSPAGYQYRQIIGTVPLLNEDLFRQIHERNERNKNAGTPPARTSTAAEGIDDDTTPVEMVRGLGKNFQKELAGRLERLRQLLGGLSPSPEGPLLHEARERLTSIAAIAGEIAEERRAFSASLDETEYYEPNKNKRTLLGVFNHTLQHHFNNSMSSLTSDPGTWLDKDMLPQNVFDRMTKGLDEIRDLLKALSSLDSVRLNDDLDELYIAGVTPDTEAEFFTQYVTSFAAADEELNQEQAQKMLSQGTEGLLELIEAEHIEMIKDKEFQLTVDKAWIEKYPYQYDMVVKWWKKLRELLGEEHFRDGITVNTSGKNGLISITCRKIGERGDGAEQSCSLHISGTDDIGPRLYTVLKMVYLGSLVPNITEYGGLVDYADTIDSINELYYQLSGIENYFDTTLDYTQDTIDKKLRRMRLYLRPIRRIDYKDELEPGMGEEALRAV